ncbi:6-phosphofructokinase [candidate division CSSED10-310 bacterium]|uniref:ATP-dependent 6-phosphofructokinase n=1 Tax=candidate division CSSED10-310 bacterium TaxID=2855610 RepID=A0ABV6Z5F2_UNCC1
MKKIVINTGGGDAPGLNAVIRALVLSAIQRGWEVYGSRFGYMGLIDYSNLIHLDRNAVRGITHLGGTILGTTNKGDPFSYPVKTSGGFQMEDLSSKVVDNFNKFGFDALIAIGGDGSLRIAHKFYELGIPVIGVPKTIDNDLSNTVITFGFDTAVTTATEALDKLHSTAEAHERVMVVEVMGRYAGWIALNSGVSATADVILIPEIPFDIEKVCQKIMDRELHGRHFGIVVVAEGATPKGGTMSTTSEEVEVGRQEVHLGGIAEKVAQQIHQITGKDCRSIVLGHLQRGGSPTTWDRLIALRFGAAAVRLVEQETFGVMVALAPPTIKAVPLKEAVERTKLVPLDSDTVLTARELGICLGD